MSGIYVHIPFCAKKCFYCDFYVTISTKYKADYLKAVNNELKIRKNYLQNETVETIYLGGGTPSLLNSEELNLIFDEIYRNYNIISNPEITLEANPDDLTISYLKDLKKTPVNRLSIGIQSFFDDDLTLMNRRHSAGESTAAVKNAQNQGYDNISGDLIYGLPNMTNKKWEDNLNQFFELNIPHLSAYHLTYEPNTVFTKYLKTGKIKEISEKNSENQFIKLIDSAKKHDFIHYETSNFAKEGLFSKHNSSYWNQKKYIGVGPSAHSYDGNSRQFNISNIKGYIEKVGNKDDYYEKEILGGAEKYNDYIITRLRTMWGCEISFVKLNFNETIFNYFIKNVENQVDEGFLIISNNIVLLTLKGKFLEDKIIESLFYLEKKLIIK